VAYITRRLWNFVHSTTLINSDTVSTQIFSQLIMSPLTQAYRPYLDRHQNLAGPGDERPTAIEVVKDLGLVGKLSDKTILITGCSAGLGVQAARALYLTGAKLYITVRNEQKGQKAIEAIMKDAPQGQTVEMVHMDLGDFDSVRSAAKDFLSRSDRLNVLINNAGKSL
jgi:hypothetical protein